MIADVQKMLGLVARPGWLTGPIFGKELRVSSRRRRNYWLRVAYVFLLTIFVVVVWLSVVDYRGSAAYQQSRMAAAGKRIVSTVVIFQFAATQILAVVMLSTAISDEVYHRTLGLLMTTPINSLQIVMGKVLSKLLQLLVLLGITLPILAIVRILGGVSWGYLLSSFCITLTAVLLAGSVSLLFSIWNRRAYAVITRAMFVLASFYFMLPMAIAALFLVPGLTSFGGRSGAFSHAVQGVLAHINPSYAISHVTEQMLSPGGGGRFSWPIHCLVMLVFSVVVLGSALKVVRQVALRQATGQLDLSENGRKKRRKRGTRSSTAADSSATGRIKRVVGPAVVWKELRAPFISGVDSRNSYIGLAMAILALAFTYWMSARGGSLDESFAHASYGLLFVFMGTMFAVIFSATRITSEKESQTWPLLLATPLSDRDILLGKAVSAFRRCLPIWGLLAVHMVVFTLVGYIHPIATVHLLVLVVWLTCFVTSAGLYFGTRFGRTTSSVVASFALVLGLWVLGPTIAGLLSVFGNSTDPLRSYMWFHPAFQAEVLMSGASGVRNADLPLRSLRYGEEHVVFDLVGKSLRFAGMTKMLLATASVYLAAAAIFFWRARCRLRRSVFR